MHGKIAIPEIIVTQNSFGWNVFDFFKHSLKECTPSAKAGWYAYILTNGIYTFYWADEESRPSESLINELKESGHTTSPSSGKVIQDYFK